MYYCICLSLNQGEANEEEREKEREREKKRKIISIVFNFVFEQAIVGLPMNNRYNIPPQVRTIRVLRCKSFHIVMVVFTIRH